jgi:hypothetical protein
MALHVFVIKETELEDRKIFEPDPGNS